MSRVITLRDYQQHEIIDPLLDYLNDHEGNPVVASPTGTGKSLAINGFIRQTIEGDTSMRFLVVAHVKEVIGQNAASMLEFWPLAPVGIYSAGLKSYDTRSSIIYCGIQSVYRKAAMFGHIDAVVCDEAHTISPKETTMWQTFLRELKKINPNIRFVGFTATPYRLGMGLITEGELFSKIVVDLTTTERINKFVEDGYLAPLVSKKPAVEFDITNVGMIGGEFNPDDLDAVSNTDDLNRAVVAECLKHGRDRAHWLVFATSIAHAEKLQTQFRSVGITCAIVHGGLDAETRAGLIGDKSQGITGAFQRGEYRCIINVGVLTTGFDFPALDLIVLARATQSTGLYVQILGRGTRPAPGKKNCLVLDFAGNIKRLGPFNAPIIPKARRKGDPGSGEAPVKVCPECSAYNHTRAVNCIECGYEFPPSSCIETTASTAKVMVDSRNEPELKVVPVNIVTYREHVSRDGNSTARITYSNMTEHYSRYDHPGSSNAFLRKKAENYWLKAGGKTPIPQTVAEFVERARKELKAPKTITIVANAKYPDIRGESF